ncbi:MAG: DUF3046 domain-containing protein [Herbiconiux sp.]|uniref:DUF3046 domain-containing protein n=1 Tax=Herbiconiux sp. TaxID=1871186 RepID=UPI001219779E|nr:DUF3046 domain-containing protein [Herbiconiux sp.]TAJ49014.1 MAG: DUF3046 domain-containing protein [Herbiconiux sp.]
MRLSEFTQAVADEFGAAYGQVVTRDLVLVDLGDRTPQQALSAGIAPRDVWLAICRTADVPPERWHGAGLPAAPRN